MAHAIQIYGKPDCPHTQRARRAMPDHEFIDVKNDPENLKKNAQAHGRRAQGPRDRGKRPGVRGIQAGRVTGVSPGRSGRKTPPPRAVVHIKPGS